MYRSLLSIEKSIQSLYICLRISMINIFLFHFVTLISIYHLNVLQDDRITICTEWNPNTRPCISIHRNTEIRKFQIFGQDFDSLPDPNSEFQYCFFVFFYILFMYIFLSIYSLLDWIWGVLFMFRNIDINTHILLIISYYQWCDCLLHLHHSHNSPLQRSRKIRIIFSQYPYYTPYTYDKTQYPYCIIYTQSELSSRLAVLKAKCSKSRIMPETTRPNTVTSSGKTSSSSYQVTAVLHTLIVTIIMIIIIIVIIIIIIIIITITIIIIIVIIIT